MTHPAATAIRAEADRTWGSDARRRRGTRSIDAIDGIEALIDEADRAAFTGRLKTDAPALRHAAGRLRTVAMQNAGPPDARTGSVCAVVDDLEELARAGTLKVPQDTLWDLLERMYMTAMPAVS